VSAFLQSASQVFLIALFGLIFGCGGGGSSGGGNNSNVSTVAFNVTGTVSNLLGEMTLELNGTETLTVNGDSDYRFETKLETGRAYNIIVSSRPTDQQCSVNNGSGNVAQADVNITISCVITDVGPVITHIWPDSLLSNYEAKISGNNLESVSVVLNGVTITPTLKTRNELRFVVPENPAETYTLELESNTGIASRSVKQGQILKNVASMAAGGKFVCAMQTNGKVMCWGKNDQGQLGNAATVDSAIPVTVSGLGTAISIDTGYAHACAVLTNGAVQCWGDNDSGQLGNGANMDSLTPVTVFGITNAIAVAAGNFHSCALLATGTVYCWGSIGALGNGSTASSSTPVPVSGINTAIAMDVGGGFGRWIGAMLG